MGLQQSFWRLDALPLQLSIYQQSCDGVVPHVSALRVPWYTWSLEASHDCVSPHCLISGWASARVHPKCPVSAVPLRPLYPPIVDINGVRTRYRSLLFDGVTHNNNMSDVLFSVNRVGSLLFPHTPAHTG